MKIQIMMEHIDFEDFFPNDATETSDSDLDGIGDNADILRMIKNTNFTGYIHNLTDYDIYLSTEVDFTITKIGDVQDYFNGKLYISGHHGTDGSEINVAVDTRSTIIRGLVTHDNIGAYGGNVTIINDNTGKFDAAVSGIAYELNLLV